MRFMVIDASVFYFPLLFNKYISLQQERIGMNDSLVTNLILK
jgi:hypothetical protein